MTVRANSEYLYTARDRTGRATRSAKRNFDSLARSAVSLGKAFVGIAGVAGIGRFIVSTTSAVDELGKLGRELDTTTQFLQEARFATQRQGGTTEELDRALRNLRRRAGEAARGNKEYAESFQALGITAAAFQNLSLEELFETLVTRLAGVENASERAALAFDVFGRASESVNRVVAGGIDEFRRLRQVNRDLGGSFSDDLVAQAEAASDAFEDLGTAANALATRYTSILLPAITGVTNAIAALARSGPQGTEGVIDRFNAVADEADRIDPGQSFEDRLIGRFNNVASAADRIAQTDLSGGFDLDIRPINTARSSVESLNDEIEKTVQRIGDIDPDFLQGLARFQAARGRVGEGPGTLDLTPENITEFLREQGREFLREQRAAEQEAERQQELEVTRRTNTLLEQILSETRGQVPLTAN